MKQTYWTQMLNRKSTSTPLLLRNCASKNSLKTLFKVNAQTKISHSESVFVQFMKHLGSITKRNYLLSCQVLFPWAVGSRQVPVQVHWLLSWTMRSNPPRSASRPLIPSLEVCLLANSIRRLAYARPLFWHELELVCTVPFAHWPSWWSC